MDKQIYIKKFIRYSSLSVLGTLGVSCYILADTFFVSKGLGTNGLAALNIAIPIYNFIHGCGLMLGMGGATKFSVCRSSNNSQKTNIIFMNTVYLALLFGVFFAVAGLFFSNSLALFLGADSNILAMTDTYLKWLLLFSPAFIMNDVLLCFVRNDDNPLLATVAMLLGSFSNIILDYIFIFPMHMGIFGAIFATGLSPVISMMIISLHWFKRQNNLPFLKVRLYWKVILQDFSLGFPSLIAQVASGVTMIIFNILILKLEGNTGVAAYGVIANISLVVVAIYTGISQGVQPLISDSYGSGDKKSIQRGLHYSMTTMTFLSFVIYLVIFVFSDSITGIFNSENNLRLQEISNTGLKLYFTSVIFIGFNIMITTFFTSIEKAVPAHILSLLKGFILIIPMAFFLSVLWGMTGIWLTCPATEGIVAALGYVIYKFYIKKACGVNTKIM